MKNPVRDNVSYSCESLTPDADRELRPHDFEVKSFRAISYAERKTNEYAWHAISVMTGHQQLVHTKNQEKEGIVAWQ